MNRVLASATAIAVAFTLNFGGAAVAAQSSGEATSGGPARSVTTATADVAANEASTSRRAPMSGDAAGSVATVSADASEVGPGQARGVSLSGDAADFGEGEVPPVLSSVAEDTAQGTSEQTPSTAELDEGTPPTDPPALGDGAEEGSDEGSNEGSNPSDEDEGGTDGSQSLDDDGPALLGTQSQSPTPLGANGDTPVPVGSASGTWGQALWTFDDGVSPKTLTLGPITSGTPATLGTYASSPWNTGQVAPADVEQIVFETGTPGAIKFPVNSSALFAVSTGGATTGLVNLVSISGLTDVDTSAVTDMSLMFFGARSLRSLDLSGWQTGAALNMWSMFASTYSLESIVGIGAWDTQQVTNMSVMFSGASSIESLDLANWDTQRVTNMSMMFSGVSSIESLDLSSWDTTGATRWIMFSDTPSLASLTLGPKTDLSGSSLPNASNAEGYTGKWVRPGQQWGYPAIPWWSGTSDDLTTFSAGADDSAGTYVWQQKAPVTLDLNYGKWPDMEAAWEAELTALGDAAVGEVVTLPNVAPVLDPAKFGNNAFDKWKGTVSGAYLIVSPGFQFVAPQPGVTLKASWTSALQLWGDAPWKFDEASGTLTVYGSGDASNPHALGELSTSPWKRQDDNRVSPASIKQIVFETGTPGDIKFPADSSKLFTASEDYLIRGLANLESISGFTGVDTSGVTRMTNMFADAVSLESLDLSGWDTGRVLDMRYMFAGARSLESLDLSNWVTTGAFRDRMFEGASSLRSLVLGLHTGLSESDLPGVSSTDPYTGEWVRTGPAPSSTEAWWSGTSAALLTRSQDPMTAAGTYVWQEKVQVAVDLGSGDWKAEDNPTNLDPLSQAAVGTLVSLPDRDPVWADHDFLGWELSVPGSAPVPVSADFIVTESGLELVATWADTTFELVFDLNGGTPSSAFAAQEGTVGQNLTIPAQVPTRGGVFIFDGWLHEGAATTYQPGAEFTMLSGGATLKAQWTPSWGEAPWQFDAATGTLTVYGNDDPANPRVLGGYTASPWNRADGSQVDPAGIKKIVFEDPTGIKFPADSRRLFTAGTDPWVPGPMSNLSEIEGIGQVDTSAVTNMAYMFMYGASLTSLDLSGWDTGEVEYLVNTFSYMSALKTLNLTDWNTEKVQSIAGTFSYTPVLESIAGLGSWNTAGVTSMQNTFNGASSLKSLDLSNWDTTGANRTGMLNGTSSLESLTLGPKTVQTNSGLPDASSTGDYTGNWVRTGPDPSSTEAWWRGTSTELESRSQNPAEAAGTYVWQKKAPVTLDLNYGEWPDMSAALEADLLALADAAVGDRVTMPTQAPTLDPEVFGSNAFKWWQGEVLEGTMSVTPGVSFVVTETGLVMDAKWSSALQLWGEAPWQFDAATGTLTVYGSDDPANPRTLGRYYASPWETGSVPPADIKTIILENPTGIALPAESGLLFSSNGYGDEPVNLTRIEGISEVNTSGVTLMWGMFWGAESLESLDLSGWETSGVDNMSNLFQDTESLTSLDVSTWETAQVTNMDHLFRSASALESLDLSNWDTTGASKSSMFEDASSLESLTLGPKTVLTGSGLPGVNSTDIFTGKWVRTGPAPSSTEAWWSGDSDELIERSEDLATVAGTYVWQRKAPVTLDLNHGDWPGAAPDLDALGVAGVGDLVTLPVDVPVFNGFEFDSWGTDPADPDRPLGAGDSFVVSEPGLVLTAQWDPPLQLWGEAPWKFDASSGTLFVYGDVANPRTLGGYPTSPWNRVDTSRVDPAGIEKIVFEDPEGIKLPVGSNYLFSAISALDFLADLTEIEGISQVDTTEVMFMAGMFSGASSLEALDLSGWDTGNVELMNSMFLGTDKLSSLTFGDKWDTSSVASMSSMFNGASSLEALDLSGWDTGSVQEMNYMFLGTDKLSSLTLGDKSRLASSADLPGVPSGISSDHTGKWVRTETSPSLTTAWWSGSSDKLILQSQDQTDAAGTYVWQQKAPVALDLNHGAWSDPVPNLDAFASAGVGDSLTLPVDVPVLNGFEFDSWGPNPADPDGTLSAGDSFVVTEPGLVLTAQWDPPLQLWGEAPWKFDTASGTVTVYGSGDSANPRILGTESQAPWHTVGSGVGPRDVEKIVFEDPESIKLPADSESLFSSRTGFPLENLRGISGIGQVNTSEVSNPRGMFSFASSLESLDLSGWDTTGFTNTEFMFSGASSLESLDLSGWVLDGNYQESLFIGASSLASLTLGAETKLAATVALRDAPDGAPYTGKWVRTGPDPSSTEAWWSGDSDELIERSQNSATAAGTYVWQMSTPVTLDFTGGSWSPGAAPDLSSIDNAAVGRLLTLPTDVPELIGYTFDGWQMSQATTRVAGMGLLDWVMAQARGAIGELGAAGSLHPGDSFMVSAPGAITLTAQWEEDVPPPAELTLSFDLGGGAAGGGVFDPITGLVEGELVTLPTDVPVRDGFAFTGWLYNDQVFNAGVEFTMPDADATLVAQWREVNQPPLPPGPPNPPVDPGAGGGAGANPALPDTGANAAPVAIGGALLLVMGAVAAALSRRRRN